jgi:hypothetical protein
VVRWFLDASQASRSRPSYIAALASQIIEEAVPPSLAAALEQAQPSVAPQAPAKSLQMMLPDVSLMMSLVDCNAGVVLQNSASIR